MTDERRAPRPEDAPEGSETGDQDLETLPEASPPPERQPDLEHKTDTEDEH